jgi:enoyl reductase
MVTAIVFTAYGGPDVLHPVEIDLPTPAAGQIRVRVKAAGVNPVDAKLRRGDFAATMPANFPQRLGNEYAGIVDQVGDGTMPWTVAAGLPAAGQAAHTALRQIAVNPGDTVLIHAAAGGVGTIAVQLACQWGATVIGTASEHNHDYLRSLDANPVTYGDGLIDRIRALAPDGVDAALDAIGGAAITASLALVRDRHRIGTLVDTEAAKTFGILRVGARSTAALTELVALYEEGRLQLPIHATFPLTQASRAHHEVQTGHVRGKVVLTMD